MSYILPTNTTPLLEANQLTCIREDRILFDHLDIAVFPGDIVQVEGPNGAGKTSLLRILAGLSQPYEGDIYFNQQSINIEREQYLQNLLYLGHLPGVKGELSAEENLNINLALHGLATGNTEQVLNQVNLLGFEDSLASHLSAGQHRRIALARLYASQQSSSEDNNKDSTKIWILDEPFTAIDKQGVASLERLFVSHASQGGCVILTTHQDLTLDASLVKKIKLDYQFY